MQNQSLLNRVGPLEETLCNNNKFNNNLIPSSFSCPSPKRSVAMFQGSRVLAKILDLLGIIRH